MINDNSHSFFRLPKKVRKVSLCKRSSISQLHQPTNPSRQLTDRRNADRLDNSKSRPVLVETSNRRMSYSRYQWLQVLRGQFLRVVEQKGVRQVSKKALINIVQQHRYSSSLPIDNSQPEEYRLQEEEVAERLQRFPGTKLGLDDLFLSLASTPEALAAQTDRGPQPQEPLQERPLRQHRPQSAEPDPPKKKPSQEDLQTARFNEDNLNLRSFPELQSIRTIQLHSPKLLSITGENSDFYKGEGEYTNMFESLFKETCRTLRSLQCLRTRPIQQKFLQELLAYGLYKNGGDNFYGVKLMQLEKTADLNSLLGEVSVVDFFKYMEAIRIFRCEIGTGLHIAFTNTLKIINLSDCGLSAVAFLKQCQEVEFVNLNHNKIRQLTPLKDMKCLAELHCFDNQVEALPAHANLSRLHILDLGMNHIADIEALAPLKSMCTLKLMNILGNPIQRTRSGLKKELARMFPHIKAFELAEVYIFSDYNRFKDIAFFTEAEKQLIHAQPSEPHRRKESKENLLRK